MQFAQWIVATDRIWGKTWVGLRFYGTFSPEKVLKQPRKDCFKQRELSFSCTVCFFFRVKIKQTADC